MLNIYRMRSNNIENIAETYGVKAIFCKPSIESYIDQNQKSMNAMAPLRSQLQNCLAFMQKCQHFEIKLSKTTPEIEIDIKSCEQVMIQGTSGTDYYNREKRRKTWGDYYIKWTDESSVLSFFLDFIETWEEIPENDRNKRDVTCWLERMLHISEPH